MKKIIVAIFFAFLFIANPVFAEDDGFFDTNYIKKELLTDLSFAEMQMFDKTYSNSDTLERLERLEIAVFGAIQIGKVEKRIKNLKKSLTNTTSGGNGLQYTTKPLMKATQNSLNLAVDGFSSGSWNIGSSGGYYNPYSYNGWDSPRVYHPRHHHHSHRMPPPPRHYGQSYNNNPITNGDLLRNYAIGTTVRILDD